ncbi:DUF6414 family protein [Clostridium butyricum]|uniref:DUF6414 family protein n=1 Tax=Clostridium butyricum TaxID=1492 RepID=UPI0032C18EF0
MRHFVYLDTDTLNSYLSQINGGLLKSTVNEASDEISTTKSDKTEPNKGNFKTEIGFKPILNFTLTENKDSINTTNTLSQIETGRELIEKILHDNAFDLFVSYLKDEQILNDTDNCILEKYIKINDTFKIRDVKSIGIILSDNFMDFMSEQAVGNLRKQLASSGLTNALKKQKEKEIENIKKQSKKEFEEYKKIFEIIGDMIPYSEFLICDNCIIPITNKYLRESLNQISFNYGGKINIVGKYTSTLKDAIEKGNSDSGVLGDFNSILNNALKELYINFLDFSEDMKIVIPIALYFE